MSGFRAAVKEQWRQASILIDFHAQELLQDIKFNYAMLRGQRYYDVSTWAPTPIPAYYYQTRSSYQSTPRTPYISSGAAKLIDEVNHKHTNTNTYEPNKSGPHAGEATKTASLVARCEQTSMLDVNHTALSNNHYGAGSLAKPSTMQTIRVSKETTPLRAHESSKAAPVSTPQQLKETAPVRVSKTSNLEELAPLIRKKHLPSPMPQLSEVQTSKSACVEEEEIGPLRIYKVPVLSPRALLNALQPLPTPNAMFDEVVDCKTSFRCPQCKCSSCTAPEVPLFPPARAHSNTPIPVERTSPTEEEITLLMCCLYLVIRTAYEQIERIKLEVQNEQRFCEFMDELNAEPYSNTPVNLDMPDFIKSSVPNPARLMARQLRNKWSRLSNRCHLKMHREYLTQAFSNQKKRRAEALPPFPLSSSIFSGNASLVTLTSGMDLISTTLVIAICEKLSIPQLDEKKEDALTSDLDNATGPISKLQNGAILATSCNKAPHVRRLKLSKIRRSLGRFMKRRNPVPLPSFSHDDETPVVTRERSQLVVLEGSKKVLVTSGVFQCLNETSHERRALGEPLVKRMRSAIHGARAGMLPLFKKELEPRSSSKDVKTVSLYRTPFLRLRYALEGSSHNSLNMQLVASHSVKDSVIFSMNEDVPMLCDSDQWTDIELDNEESSSSHNSSSIATGLDASELLSKVNNSIDSQVEEIVHFVSDCKNVLSSCKNASFQSTESNAEQHSINSPVVEREPTARSYSGSELTFSSSVSTEGSWNALTSFMNKMKLEVPSRLQKRREAGRKAIFFGRSSRIPRTCSSASFQEELERIRGLVEADKAAVAEAAAEVH